MSTALAIYAWLCLGAELAAVTVFTVLTWRRSRLVVVVVWAVTAVAVWVWLALMRAAGASI